jgi:hypothetical protein
MSSSVHFTTKKERGERAQFGVLSSECKKEESANVKAKRSAAVFE